MRSAALILLGALILAAACNRTPAPLAGIWLPQDKDWSKGVSTVDKPGTTLSMFTEYRADGTYLDVTHYSTPSSERYTIFRGTWSFQNNGIKISTPPREVITLLGPPPKRDPSGSGINYTIPVDSLTADTLIYKSPDGPHGTYRPTFTRGTTYPPDMNPEVWSKP